jgi:hypothetical protein
MWVHGMTRTVIAASYTRTPQLLNGLPARRDPDLLETRRGRLPQFFA